MKGNQGYEKILLALKSGIQLKESGIPQTIGYHNPISSAGKDWNPVLESGIQGVEFRIQDCLGFPYIVRNLHFYMIIWATKMSVRLSNQ